eukprot:TRINITY_DN25935_c0_g1_i2.p1 TRINITY_DN25935_c0_g1~~TRINITY_DN25935_c0_g1_i2.p1  ORF type:complete len:2146 (+),score=699.63 TRINITY_DN25935_c0_g1_i2:126-6563(+)
MPIGSSAAARSGSTAVAAGSGAQGASSINAASRTSDSSAAAETVALVRSADSDEGAVWSQEEQRRYVKALGIAKLPGEEHVVQFVTDCLGLSPLPKPWEIHRDSQGRIFYGNMSTGETSWRHPLEDVFRELAGVCRVIISLTRDLREPCVANLRETWEAFAKDEFSQWYSVLDPGSGMEYYCNSATGATMWEHPAEVLLPGHYLKLKAADRLLDEEYLMTILTFSGSATKEGSDSTITSFYQRTLMNSSTGSFNKQRDDAMKEQLTMELESHKAEAEAQRAEVTRVSADFKDLVDRFEAAQKSAENADKIRQEIQAQFDMEKKRAQDAIAECESMRTEKQQVTQSLAETQRANQATIERLAEVEQQLSDSKAIQAMSAAAATAAEADPEAAQTSNAALVEEVLSHIAKAARDFKEVSSDLQRARAECADLVVRHAESEKTVSLTRNLSDDRQAKLKEMEQELASIRGHVNADTDRMSPTQTELDKVMKQLAESQAAALQDSKFRGDLEAKLREAKAQIEELKGSRHISITVADGDILEELSPFSIGQTLPQTVAALQAQLADAAAEFEKARTDFNKLAEEQAQAQLEAQETENLFKTSRGRLQELAEKEALQASAMQITASAVMDAAALAEQASNSDLVEEVLSHIAKAAKEFQEVSADAEKAKTAYAELADKHAEVERKASDARLLSDERQAKLIQVEQELARIRGSVTEDKDRLSSTQVELDTVVRDLADSHAAAAQESKFRVELEEKLQDARTQVEELKSRLQDFQEVSDNLRKARAEYEELADKHAATEKKVLDAMSLSDERQVKVDEVEKELESIRANSIEDVARLTFTQTELENVKKDLAESREAALQDAKMRSEAEDDLRAAKGQVDELKGQLQELADKETIRAMMATDEAAGVAPGEQESTEELVMDVLSRINRAAKDFKEISEDAEQARAESAGLANKVVETEEKALNAMKLSEQRQVKLDEVEQELSQIRVSRSEDAAQLKATQVELDKVMTELTQSQENALNYSQSRTDLEDKLREAKGEVEELKAQLQDTSVLSSTLTELDKARKELDESRAVSRQESMSRSHLEDELRKAKEEMESLRARLQAEALQHAAGTAIADAIDVAEHSLPPALSEKHPDVPEKEQSVPPAITEKPPDVTEKDSAEVLQQPAKELPPTEESKEVCEAQAKDAHEQPEKVTELPAAEPAPAEENEAQAQEAPQAEESEEVPGRATETLAVEIQEAEASVAHTVAAHESKEAETSAAEALAAHVEGKRAEKSAAEALAAHAAGNEAKTSAAEALAAHAEGKEAETSAAEALAAHAESNEAVTSAAEALAAHAESTKAETLAAEALAAHAESNEAATSAAEALAAHAESTEGKTLAAEALAVHAESNEAAASAAEALAAHADSNEAETSAAQGVPVHAESQLAAQEPSEEAPSPQESAEHASEEAQGKEALEETAAEPPPTVHSGLALEQPTPEAESKHAPEEPAPEAESKHAPEEPAVEEPQIGKSEEPAEEEALASEEPAMQEPQVGKNEEPAQEEALAPKEPAREEPQVEKREEPAQEAATAEVSKHAPEEPAIEEPQVEKSKDVETSTAEALAAHAESQEMAAKIAQELAAHAESKEAETTVAQGLAAHAESKEAETSAAQGLAAHAERQSVAQEPTEEAPLPQDSAEHASEYAQGEEAHKETAMDPPPTVDSGLAPEQPIQEAESKHAPAEPAVEEPQVGKSEEETLAPEEPAVEEPQVAKSEPPAQEEPAVQEPHVEKREPPAQEEALAPEEPAVEEPSVKKSEEEAPTENSKPAPEEQEPQAEKTKESLPTPKVAAAATEQLQAAKPKESEVEQPTTKIEFAFKNLDFAAVMAKPDVQAGLTSQVQKGISEHVGVPPEKVKVTLMPGSVIVHAAIPCDDAQTAAAVSSAASGGDMLGAIGQLAAEVPGIAATMASGHSDFILGGLKTTVQEPEPKQATPTKPPAEKPGLTEKLQKLSAGTAELQSSIAATSTVLKTMERPEESKKELGTKMAELKQVLETQALAPLEVKKALTDEKHRSLTRRRMPFKTVEHRGRTWARRVDALAVAKHIQHLETESHVSRCQIEHMQTFVKAFDSTFAVKMKLQLHKDSLQNFNQAIRSEVSQLQEQLRQLEVQRDALKANR